MHAKRRKATARPSPARTLALYGLPCGQFCAWLCDSAGRDRRKKLSIRKIEDGLQLKKPAGVDRRAFAMREPNQKQNRMK